MWHYSREPLGTLPASKGTVGDGKLGTMECEAGAGALVAEIEASFDEMPRPQRLVAAFRSADLLVPVIRPGAVISVDYGGITWLPVFTDVGELRYWLESRGDGPAGSGCQQVMGARLLDRWLTPGIPR